jgi:energy-coupling factor transporter ATP-binding protein EcfA2
MRVTRFVPYQLDVEDAGLTNVDMPRLGHLVVLAGPNGGGKTRTLSILRESLVCLQTNYTSNDGALERNIKTFEKHLENPEHPEHVRVQHQTNLRTHGRIRALRSGLQITPPNQYAKIHIASFSAASSRFSDPGALPSATAKQHFESALAPRGTDHLKAHALTYISHVASQHWNATHPETTFSAIDPETARAAWKSLQNIVEILLNGMKLSRNENGEIVINGRLAASAGLSDGQKALLVVATTLHAQSAKLDEAIILIDEPELYLHPSALLEYIDQLINATPRGQVWIATHSVHILSHVDPSCLWFVDDGTVTWAGKRPETVLAGLVGDDQRVGRLQRFLHLPALYAMERFVAECLTPPAIVSTGAEDPQSTQIRTILAKIAESPLRVLDYGAGVGRILAALREGTNDISVAVDYRAYEINEMARKECLDTIADAYGISDAQAADRVSGDETTLRARLNPGSVHVVVMCNVLHEIEPSKWSGLFRGIMAYCLHSNGYLLIVEDMQIPHGEHAHTHGFILLDTEQLKELFAVDRESSEQFRTFGTDRLKAHLIHASALSEVSPTTVKNALIRRRDSAKDVIRQLRSTGPSFRNGQLLGLYAMLHANASLALDEL